MRKGCSSAFYTRKEIDAIAAYCAEVDRVFLVSVSRIDGRSHIQLRLRVPLNNQKIGINWADDFDFAATLGRLKGP